MQTAINALWRYTNELFEVTEADKAMIEKGVGVDVTKFKEAFYKEVSELLTEATIEVPENKYFSSGGKKGIHTEHMGYILADMQYMQRAYPNMKW